MSIAPDRTDTRGLNGFSAADGIPVGLYGISCDGVVTVAVVVVGLGGGDFLDFSFLVPIILSIENVFGVDDDVVDDVGDEIDDFRAAGDTITG